MSEALTRTELALFVVGRAFDVVCMLALVVRFARGG